MARARLYPRITPQSAPHFCALAGRSKRKEPRCGGAAKSTFRIPCCQGLWPNGGEGLGWGGAHTIRHSPTQRFEADGVPAAISPTQGKAPGRDRALDLYAPVLPALCSMKLFLHKKLRA
jgi:hypothetical protein